MLKSRREAATRAMMLGLLSAALVLLAGCQSAYYAGMEKIGYHKRDILADRVEDAAEAQQEAAGQFRSALERFGAVVAYDGGELQERYDRLSAEFDLSEEKADAVRERVDAVEDVAEALFAEWKEELGQYKSAELRRKSEKRLAATRAEYKKLMRAMRRAEKSMDPVLAAFRDQVLFLKHNLNARAVASLKGELASVEDDVSVLVREMEASVAEAEAFVRSMESGG